jgi:HK97 family phage portal protein
MNLGISNLFKKKDSIPTLSNRDIETYMSFITGVGLTNGKDVLVSQSTALKIGVVLECVDIITKTLSLVSPKIYNYQNGEKTLDPTHPLNETLTKNTYTLYDSSKYYQRMIINYLLYGNAYARIIKKGQMTYLKIYKAGDVEPYIIKILGVEEHWYKVIGEDGPIPQSEMIHIYDITLDGIKGLSKIRQKEGFIKDSGYLQNYGAEMYRNGSQISGLLIADGSVRIEKEALEYMRSKFQSKYSSKIGEIAGLPPGYKYEPMKYNLPLSDAQLLEAKKYSVEEISRIFGVPLSLLNRGDIADNKADSEYNRFLITTIAPLCLLIENEHNRKLFTGKLNSSYYMKFELKGLYRTDILTRYQAHQIALNHGFMNKDEVRSVEGMNPIPNNLGKSFYQMLNTIPLEKVDEYYSNLIENNNTKNKTNDVTGI